MPSATLSLNIINFRGSNLNIIRPNIYGQSSIYKYFHVHTALTQNIRIVSILISNTNDPYIYIYLGGGVYMCRRLLAVYIVQN